KKAAAEAAKKKAAEDAKKKAAAEAARKAAEDKKAQELAELLSDTTERQQALARVILADPAVDSLSSYIGVDGDNVTLNSGRLLINLKPHGERDLTASQIIDRLRPELAK
ncbi:hypothetical protein, partial [Klebsiella pneumoniae]|uniref:hypothetical protein n=1 Tax=Klebsiella pneumoniae TaxID=573 RepID=UPI00210C396D